ncbi:hypothetical protein Taro_047216 [Colocasia esculenta]|uniref:Uncharacterized protein n=1 Tax=Colocasia esculenta TaxID=4460 RepID=A0A843X0J9_COLES|nr:hypothetical protein [Colocasia esculenta]
MVGILWGVRRIPVTGLQRYPGVSSVNLKDFLVTAEAEVRTLTSLYFGVGRNADALALYFGEDPVRCPFEQASIHTPLNLSLSIPVATEAATPAASALALRLVMEFNFTNYRLACIRPFTFYNLWSLNVPIKRRCCPRHPRMITPPISRAEEKDYDFVDPEGMPANLMVVTHFCKKSLQKKLRDWRCWLKNHYYIEGVLNDVLVKAPDKRITQGGWELLLKFWESEKKVTEAERNKKIRVRIDRHIHWEQSL